MSRKRFMLARKLFPLFILVLISAGIFVFYAFRRDVSPIVTPPPGDALYLDAKAPIDARIDDLLSRMTLREKAAQMALVEKNSVHDENDIATYALGGLLSGFGGKPENNTIGGWKDMIA